MLQKSLGERHVAVTSDKGSAASGGRWQEQIMCGASLFEKPPASIHGQVIGRNRRNSLIPVLSYCCSLAVAVAIVTADLSPTVFPSLAGRERWRRLLRVPAKFNSLAGVQLAVVLAVASIYLTCQGVCVSEIPLRLIEGYSRIRSNASSTYML